MAPDPKQLHELLGGGPLAGIGVVLLLGIIGLTVMLVRSYRAQVEQAWRLAALAEKMIAATDSLDQYVHALRATARDLKARVQRRSTSPADAPTVFIKPVREDAP